jgi:pseudaminic acid cytidylyltransferase
LKRVAIIPARGNSKRIPKKNIKKFLGSPIISYSILAAQNSQLFDRIIVSTDSEEIASVAEKYGAEIPFFRPQNLSDDHTGTNEVCAHAIRFFQNSGETFHYICCLYAAAPFITPENLVKGYNLIKKSEKDFVFSATSFTSPIFRAFQINSSNEISMFWPEKMNTRSQDLLEAFHDAGQFYWGRPDSFLKKKPVFAENSSAIILPRHMVQDIDTIEDWKRAENMFLANQMQFQS